MPSCVALLRAVNLGSHNKVSMAELRTFVEKLGMRDVKTVVQSGNLVFQDRLQVDREARNASRNCGHEGARPHDRFLRAQRE